MLIDPSSVETPARRYQWKPVLIGLLFINLVGVLALVFVPNASSTQAMHAKPNAAGQPMAHSPSDEVTRSSAESQAVLSIDHSIMNDPNLPEAPNPAPMAIAAYY